MLVRNNQAVAGGAFAGCQGPIVNCLVIDNSADNGAAFNNCDGDIVNCTVVGNSTVAEGVFRMCDGMVTNCIIYNNTGEVFYDTTAVISFSCYPGAFGWTNIDADPLLVFEKDYHITTGSPCIDAGTNNLPVELPVYDIEGGERVFDGDGDGQAVVDMGAYEFDDEYPRIAVSTTVLEFTTHEGFVPEAKTLLIKNCGGNTLDWRISEDIDWFSVEPQSGSSQGEADMVVISPDVSALSAGIYEGILKIESNAAANSPVVVVVRAVIKRTLIVPGDYLPIQCVIDVAQDGDLVLVKDGIYRGDGNRDIVFNGKAITVQSATGADNCIIDCQGSEQEPHRGFFFNKGEKADSVVKGFSIINGYEERGPGIFCYNSSPTIINCKLINNYASDHGGAMWFRLSDSKVNNCILEENTATNWGGGICCYDKSSVTISGCRFEGNKAGLGGGVYCGISDVKIADCVFESNESTLGGGVFSSYNSLALKRTTFKNNFTKEEGEGGGFYGNNCTVTISDCQFRDNKCPYPSKGGGAYFNECMPIVLNSYFSGNSATEGGGMCCYYGNLLVCNSVFTGNMSRHWGGGAGMILCTGRIFNCTFADNRAGWDPILSYEGEDKIVVVNSILWNGNLPHYGIIDIEYSNLLGDIEGEGNISSNPCFVMEGHWDDNGTPLDILDDIWIDGDYRLRSYSPCIDTGDPDSIIFGGGTDIDGNKRVADGDGDGQARIDMGAYEYLPIVSMQVTISPGILKLKSHGPSLSAKMEVPESLSITEDDIDVILLDGKVAAFEVSVEQNSIKGTFDRAEAIEYLTGLGVSGEVELIVTCRLSDGTVLEGKDTIKVLE